jgi:hypothetical protein
MDKKEELAQLLREAVVPAAQGPTPVVHIERLYVVVPGNGAVELLTAIRQLLKEP